MPAGRESCTACGHDLEALQKFSDAPLANCPSCHAATLVKLLSAARQLTFLGDPEGVVADLNARGLLEWSLLFAHNMTRECFYPQGHTTVPTTLYSNASARDVSSTKDTSA